MELTNEFERNENSGSGPSKQKPTEDETEALLKKIYMACKKANGCKALREEWKRHYDAMEGAVHLEQAATQPTVSEGASVSGPLHGHLTDSGLRPTSRGLC